MKNPIPSPSRYLSLEEPPGWSCAPVPRPCGRPPSDPGPSCPSPRSCPGSRPPAPAWRPSGRGASLTGPGAGGKQQQRQQRQQQRQQRWPRGAHGRPERRLPPARWLGLASALLAGSLGTGAHRQQLRTRTRSALAPAGGMRGRRPGPIYTRPPAQGCS